MTTSPSGIRRSAPSPRRGAATRSGWSPRTLESVGPNATLVAEDLEGLVRQLKAEREGEIEVAGTLVAQSLTDSGLIDEYRIYLHPVVLGQGKPFFAGPRPPLRLLAHDQLDDDVIRLTYVPALEADTWASAAIDPAFRREMRAIDRDLRGS